MVEYARQLNRMRKIVFSKTLSRAEWSNTVLLREIVPEEILQMKRESGREMVIYGSARVVQELINLGLIDRYNLLVFPVVLGKGKSLFHSITHKVKMALVSNMTYPSGVVELAYELVKN